VFSHVFSDQNADEGFGERGKSSFFCKKASKGCGIAHLRRICVFFKILQTPLFKEPRFEKLSIGPDFNTNRKSS
jgi:hypothetical protein